MAASLASYSQMSTCKLLIIRSLDAEQDGMSPSENRKASTVAGTYLQAPVNPLLPGNLTINFIPLEQLLQQFIGFGFGDLVVQIRAYVCRTVWPILSLEIQDNELAGVRIR